jgi:hypothetical protein
MTNKFTMICLGFTFLLGISLSISQNSKEDYDIKVSSPSGGLFKNSYTPIPGWEVKQLVSEISVSPGGFLTWGTNNGLSPLPLDDHCTLLFGHPYARTSYPLIFIDGVWQRADLLFPRDSNKVQVIGDSSMILTLTGHPSLSFSIQYTLANHGTQLQCDMSLITLDKMNHQLAIGHILDPELGPRGDAVIKDGTTKVQHDTLLPGKSLMMVERSHGAEGIRVGLDFQSRKPSLMILTNWKDVSSEDSPSFSPSKTRTLYDAVLKMYWDTVQTASYGTPDNPLKRSFTLSLAEPDFGSSIFTRWDIPRFIIINDGSMHPAEIPTVLSVFNKGVQSANASITLLQNNYVLIPVARKDTTIPSYQYAYAQFLVQPLELYEDAVAEVTVTVGINNGATDSLTIPIFIPATPVCDTGLTVMIDSLMHPSLKEITLRFEVTKTSTEQRIYSLKPQHLFVYENAIRVPSFSLMKDTSGGNNALDLIFVLDVTGSMGDEIADVLNNIAEFADSLTFQAIDFRLGMVTFLDAVENIYPFTTNASQFKGYVALQNAHAGGDEPENSLEALYQASLFSFRNNARRTVIWITDATYQEKNTVTPRTKSEVINKLLENDIVVYAVGPTYNQTNWYNPIIEPTGGSFFDIGGNFRDILLNISRLHTTSKYLLRYTSPITSGGMRTVTLVVHSSLYSVSVDQKI